MTNIADPDQLALASDQDLHCLPYSQQFLDTQRGGKNWLVWFGNKVWIFKLNAKYRD